MTDLDTDAKIVKVPVALRDSWMPHAKLYYALSQMNEIDDLHNLIFEEIKQNNRLDTEQAMIEFLSKTEINTKFSWRSITVTVLKQELKSKWREENSN